MATWHSSLIGDLFFVISLWLLPSFVKNLPSFLPLTLSTTFLHTTCNCPFVLLSPFLTTLPLQCCCVTTWHSSLISDLFLSFRCDCCHFLWKNLPSFLPLAFSTTSSHACNYLLPLWIAIPVSDHAAVALLLRDHVTLLIYQRSIFVHVVFSIAILLLLCLLLHAIRPPLCHGHQIPITYTAFFISDHVAVLHCCCYCTAVFAFVVSNNVVVSRRCCYSIASFFCDLSTCHSLLSSCSFVCGFLRYDNVAVFCCSVATALLLAPWTNSFLLSWTLPTTSEYATHCSLRARLFKSCCVVISLCSSHSCSPSACHGHFQLCLLLSLIALFPLCLFCCCCCCVAILNLSTMPSCVCICISSSAIISPFLRPDQHAPYTSPTHSLLLLHLHDLPPLTTAAGRNKKRVNIFDLPNICFPVLHKGEPVPLITNRHYFFTLVIPSQEKRDFFQPILIFITFSYAMPAGLSPQPQAPLHFCCWC